MNEGFDTFSTDNQYQFSGMEMDSLGATEYTIVNMLADETGSVWNFKTQLEDAMKEVITSCEKHPRSENLLIRAAAFSSRGIREMFGFSTLDTIDTSKLKVNPDGSTPLYSATLEAIETVNTYAQNLNDMDYFCNGILFVITDGGENTYNVPLSKIKDAAQKIRTDESLESIRMILIGVNDNNPTLKDELNKFKDDAGFDEYISIGDVDAGSLAKLAQFISNSISSTSQALGSGGPSNAVNFTL